MKRIGLISILLGLGFTNAYPQDSIVSIPDTAFLHALIEEGVDLNGDGLISFDEAEAATSLDASAKGMYDGRYHIIKSLEGIEAFINLDSLNCNTQDSLTELDLSNNPNLTYLSCDGHIWWIIGPCFGKLESLDLSNNPLLKTLNCRGNQLTSLDVSNNTMLTDLNCASNQLTRLDVSKNTALEELDLYENPSLSEVCVWEDFNPVKLEISTWGSPNVCFQTVCDGSCTTDVLQFQQKGLSIYPNPINNILTIETNSIDNYI